MRSPVAASFAWRMPDAMEQARVMAASGYSEVPMKRQHRLQADFIRWLLRGCLLASLLFTPAQAAEVAARVQFVFGQVGATDPGGESRLLRRGDEVYAGDTLQSAAASTAQLVFRDNSRLAVRANTTVRIERYHYDADDRAGSNSLIALLRGAVRSITGLIGKYNRRNVALVTPVATIGIRGTDYEVVHVTEASADGALRGLAGTFNKVYSGATRLQSARGLLPLDAGQVGFVAGTPGNAAAPVLIDALPDAVADLLALGLPVGDEREQAGASATRELLDGLLADNAVALDLNTGALGDLVNRSGATAAQAAGGILGNGTGALGDVGGALPGGGSLPLNTDQLELPRF